ncbi:putative L-2-hydroxyglutarate dehydrogenase [Helianthus annuus]|uniref:L-2-hydroxyglutarate dehydrogenase, mitochondrial n=1 Tax=Helianthus annuus TaxID=4232 RepID=A0A251VG55_HELAN|nr:L-2-hydroxyglutarate dehydrogenase, mitochondrial [Helianthus annuus]XP_022020755.1 L-2-hydroxyglutarate dehydrogenase, mitochondrial [Helianthus annuus]XP_022020761.1 L-2-hydroxyglutarate dehydrogenase, mitochondrial [Helianthus annuus]KAF5818794.1 putative L-2-hydroxyglutarate dehydrogenase [Helianthus annuus]KAJ0605033.1 putative L-2-hydroxyglutarate dehydrogenase [Helianthus annuus]KAJ0619046.1 putative L-2-hydroxyglutarate dehydrogenase [Helianthus annuus]KAJ0777499.1 putative L-2-hyd
MKITKLVRTFLSQNQWFKNCRNLRSGAVKESVDCVVIGAGVVGIAVARELSLNYGRNVLVIESDSSFGTGSSSRNSQVIHGGIYYPPASLKGRFCVRGRRLLYEYCKQHGIPHKQIGKLIVATRHEEVPKLSYLLNRGNENGVEGLRMMEASEAMAMEPHLQCIKALWSPTSGIIDSHSLMLSLLGEAESHGTTFCYNNTVVGAHFEGNQIYLHVSETETVKKCDHHSQQHPDILLLPKLVVNSAGLSAAAVARCFRGINPGVIPPYYYARGCYFSLLSSKVPPFKHLIYPIPEDGGLGVHVTLDLDGQIKFGPDVEWLDPIDDISSIQNKFDYTVCADRAQKFYPEIRKYYPSLKDDSLQPGYAGIRPKVSGPGAGFADFIIQGEETHGIPGLVNLFGIESPGLTSSMAIAEHVATQLSV